MKELHIVCRTMDNGHDLEITVYRYGERRAKEHKVRDIRISGGASILDPQHDTDRLIHEVFYLLKD